MNRLGFRASRSGVSPVTLAIPILLIVVLAATTARYFLSWENLTNLSGQMTALLIVSRGQLLVAIVAGLDLSVGSVMSLATCIVAMHDPLILTIPLALALGAIVGIVNGGGVVLFRIHPIVMTLSSATFLQGVAYLVRPVPGGEIPHLLSIVANGRVLGVPYSLFWSAACAGGLALLLSRSRLGLHLFATGANPVSAHLNGVRVPLVTISAYVVCSMLAALAFSCGARCIGRSGDRNVVRARFGNGDCAGWRAIFRRHRRRRRRDYRDGQSWAREQRHESSQRLAVHSVGRQGGALNYRHLRPASRVGRSLRWIPELVRRHPPLLCAASSR